MASLPREYPLLLQAGPGLAQLACAEVTAGPHVTGADLAAHVLAALRAQESGSVQASPLIEDSEPAAALLVLLLPTGGGGGGASILRVQPEDRIGALFDAFATGGGAHGARRVMTVRYQCVQ